MKVQIQHIREKLTSSYWFVPGMLFAAGAGLALLMLYIDRNYLVHPGKIGWLYSGGSDGAMSVLSTVASSVITVAGVVFSITVATLTQASSQFGPRLLRNFMRDRGNQAVLGVFVMTFIYCLLVLRAVRGLEDVTFVPHLSVTLAVLMAVASVGVLVYFIHHISVSLQAPQVVAHTTWDLPVALHNMFPAGLGKDAPNESRSGEPEWARSGEGAGVSAASDGYLQAVDGPALTHLAESRDLFMAVSFRPGHFVRRGDTMITLWPAERVNDEIREQVQSAFIQGIQRTAEQDIEFVVHQLSEIAVRSLSAGVNDPFTVLNCIEWLCAVIVRIEHHGLPTRDRYDGKGKLRFIAPGCTFDGIVDAAFNGIRQYGRASPMVMIHLLDAMTSSLAHVVNPAHRREFRRHAGMVFEDARSATIQERDRADLQNRYEAFLKACGPDTGS